MDSIFSSKKNREALMDSEILQTSNQNQPSNYGLLRFRSAPSSLLGNYTNSCSAPKVSDSFEGFLNLQDFRSHRVQDLGNESQPNLGKESAVNQRSFHNRRVSNSLLPPYYPRQSSVSRGDGGFSNLSRQGSSPPGLFNHLSVQNGYATMGGVGNTSGEVSPSPTGFKGVINYSSGLPSSLGLLSQISEVGSHSPGYAYGSWNENFNGVKRDPDGDGVLFPQNGELENHTSFLSHHLSLLKTPVEMASLEKFLQYPDSVPCKIRAKRGCATHPRSIAERVRRSRISERMRKLQELVPNMEKQTNTADMLDLAVEYIKDLQRQFKTLCDHRAKCKCSNLQKSAPNPIV